MWYQMRVSDLEGQVTTFQQQLRAWETDKAELQADKASLLASIADTQQKMAEHAAAHSESKALLVLVAEQKAALAVEMETHQQAAERVTAQIQTDRAAWEQEKQALFDEKQTLASQLAAAHAAHDASREALQAARYSTL